MNEQVWVSDTREVMSALDDPPELLQERETNPYLE